MPDPRRKGNGDARMKRVILPILCLLLLLSASGCGSILEGEVSVIEPYAARYDDGQDDSEDAPILTTDAEFAQAVQEMLTQEKTDAVFRIPLPEDTSARETELMDICRSVALETPLGSYAVYYISCRLTPIVAYCNVQVSVTYKREAEDIGDLFTVSSLRYMDSRLQTSLSNFSETLVFRTDLDEITTDYLTERITYLFRRAPLDMVTEPDLDVICYPAPTGDRIMELKFLWPYKPAVLDDMRGRMISRSDEIASRTGNAGDYSVIQTLIVEHSSGALLLPAPSSALTDSAYGYLVTRAGTRKSAALSLKVLCDRLNIGCYVVEGWHNGENAWWNIISCDGKWYHADPTGMRVSPADGSLLLSDEVMIADQYFWDTDAYPACPEGYPLTWQEETGPLPDETEIAGQEAGEAGETAAGPSEGDGAADDGSGPQPDGGASDEQAAPDGTTEPEEENENGRQPSDQSEQEEMP